MIQLRKENEILIYGRYTLLDKNNPDVYAFTREPNGKKILMLLNFKTKEAAINPEFDLSTAKVLISNYSTASTNGTLRPYEAIIYELQ